MTEPSKVESDKLKKCAELIKTLATQYKELDKKYKSIIEENTNLKEKHTDDDKIITLQNDNKTLSDNLKKSNDDTLFLKKENQKLNDIINQLTEKIKYHDQQSSITTNNFEPQFVKSLEEKKLLEIEINNYKEHLGKLTSNNEILLNANIKMINVIQETYSNMQNVLNTLNNIN